MPQDSITEKKFQRDIYKAFAQYHSKRAISFQGMVLIARIGISVQDQALDGPFASLVEDYRVLASALEPDEVKVFDFFLGMFLISTITDVEALLIEICTAIIVKYPHKVGDIKLEFKDIIGLGEDEIVSMAAEQYVAKIMFERPAEYWKKLCHLMSIDARKYHVLWPAIAEAKARRDLGVHNGWLVNETYRRKTSELGITLTYELGASLLPNDEYFIKLDAAVAKFFDVLKSDIFEVHKVEALSAVTESRPLPSAY